MLFRQIGRTMLISAATMAVAVLIFLVLTTSTEVTAAERIPDSELAKLYGGWWYYNPSCAGGRSCPSHSVCLFPTDCCVFCQAVQGERCISDSSHIPDWNGCKTGSVACPNDIGAQGWCVDTVECIVGSCESERTCGGSYDTCAD